MSRDKSSHLWSCLDLALSRTDKKKSRVCLQKKMGRFGKNDRKLIAVSENLKWDEKR